MSRSDPLIGLGVLLVLFGAMALSSLGFPTRARFYPLFVGVLGVLLASGEMWLVMRAAARSDADAKPARPVESGPPPMALARAFRDVVPYLLWLVGYLAAIALVGMMTASGLFVSAFLWREGDVSAVKAGLGAVAVVVLLLVVGSVFSLQWPGALFDPLAQLGVL